MSKLKDICLKAKSPTKEIVKEYLQKYDNDPNNIKEDKVLAVIGDGKYDIDKYEVILLAVVAINQLYSTNVFHITKLADHIYSNRKFIHDLIYSGDVKAVSAIASDHGIKSSRTEKELCFYSFASKYCNLLMPEKFPIYDSYIENMLCMYNVKNHFWDFSREDLRDYETFKTCIIKFKEHFELKDYSLREIDKFLWRYGKEFF